MKTARAHAGGAVVAAADASAHCLLAVGGEDSNSRPIDSCELYDAVADRWSLQEALLPQQMCCYSAPIAGGSAVLAVQSNDNKKTCCALVDMRSSSRSWQLMASPESARRYHAVAAVGEYSVVMLGGYNSATLQTATAQLYDVRADRWSERAEWRLPAPSIEHCAVLID